ncbi:MAG TPA: 4Fe-4S dicluster domain-containing protein, partial [Methylocystis sp.]|nr:4Fe-4S dicluster domain-containing protein [Methylocystis sp.]
SMERDGEGMRVSEAPDESERLAFIGVRACELHAIAIQDKVMLGGPYVDSHYRKRREGLFIVAVNCGHPGGTCFCVSMGTGPEAKSGFDLSLTEILGESGHVFLVRVGSEAGAETLAELPRRAATPQEVAAGDEVVAAAASAMGREMRADDLHELLARNLEHPRWNDVAERCLTCANCTMVCPTCFCTAVEDTSALDGSRAERSRRWDSCFTMDFSYLHGGGVRTSTKSRYRQWMTHKLATWFDQFGSSGCVGCGRCITWCPVGIDITEEARAIRESESR